MKTQCFIARGGVLFRLLAIGAVACGLIAADTGTARAELFKGRTAQGYRIKVVAREQAFRIHVFDIDLRCRDGSELALIEGGFLWTKTGKGGGFKDSQFGRTDSVYFRGRLTEKRIRGRVRVTDKLGNGTRCSSRWIGFNATPR
jgi:hypothetical protein